MNSIRKHDVNSIIFFASISMFLSAAECAIPKPVPFFRLGLANLPVMISLAKMKKTDTLILVFLKVLCQALVSGTLFSYVFLFSLCGSFSSVLAMMAIYSLFKNRSYFSWIPVSLVGGLLNNIAQLILASFFMFGENTKVIAPAMLTVSFFSSLILGIFTVKFTKKSAWFANFNTPDSFLNTVRPESESESEGESTAETETKSSDEKSDAKRFFSAIFKILSVFILIGMGFCKNLFTIYAVFFIFASLTFCKRRKIRLLPSLGIIFSITLISLLSPYGKTLFNIGDFAVTLGALTSGLIRGGRLCAMVFISQSFVFAEDVAGFSGKTGNLLNKILFTFGVLSRQKISVKRGEFIKSIDCALIKSFYSVHPSQKSQIPPSNIGEENAVCKSSQNLAKSNQNRKSRIVFSSIFAAIFIAVTALSFWAALTPRQVSPQLIVQTPKGEYIYPLTKNAELQFEGALGITNVKIQDGKAFVTESPCHNKNCIAKGKLSEGNDWTACLPNRIMLRVRAASEKLDAIAE